MKSIKVMLFLVSSLFLNNVFAFGVVQSQVFNTSVECNVSSSGSLTLWDRESGVHVSLPSPQFDVNRLMKSSYDSTKSADIFFAIGEPSTLSIQYLMDGIYYTSKSEFSSNGYARLFKTKIESSPKDFVIFALPSCYSVVFGNLATGEVGEGQFFSVSR